MTKDSSVFNFFDRFMKKILSFIEKNFPRLYESAKNSEFVNNLFAYIHLFFFVLKKERKLFPFFLKCTISYYILRNKSDVTFEFRWNMITMPRHLKWLDWFIEVWNDQFYDKIKWYNHVLDLWWYIWDSTIKFAQTNKKVTVYEAHHENFKYLIKNTKHLKNIVAYNQAVIWNKNEKFVKFYWWCFNMWAGNWHLIVRDKYIKVPTAFILDILKNEKFDALKMDIEWAEYECFDTIISDNEDNFLFKKWFIEFHLWKNKTSDLEKILKIVNRLENKKYIIKYYDVINNKYFSTLNDLKSGTFLLYFYYEY